MPIRAMDMATAMVNVSVDADAIADVAVVVAAVMEGMEATKEMIVVLVSPSSSDVSKAQKRRSRSWKSTRRSFPWSYLG